MKDIHINVFNSQYDSKVKPLETTWENIVNLFTSPHETLENKTDAKLFNGIRYKSIDEIPEYTDDWGMDNDTGEVYVKRRQINIIENHLLILDYDGGTTLNEMIDRFKEYEFIYYTSYRHLHDGKTEKFRIVFSLSKPIPAWKRFNEYKICIDYGEWFRITEALSKFAGPCDPTSFRSNTIYNIPSVPQSRIDLSRSGHNKGEHLNWGIFEQIPFERTEGSTFIFDENNKKHLSSKHLEPDQVLQTKQGPIIVSEVTGEIRGVICPFHEDKKGSEFVKKVESSGNIFLRCRKCDTNYYMRRTVNPPESLTFNKKKPIHKPKREDRVHTYDELLEFPDDKVYFDSSERSRVTKQLADIKKKIDSDKGYASSTIRPVYTDLHLRKYKSHILFMPEGAGKSHLVVNMAKEGKRIIFACKSWEQVESKYDEYKRIGIQDGFNVRIIRSKEAKARRRFKTKLVRDDQKHPFSNPQILDNESVDEFISNNPDLNPEFVRLSWEFFSSDRLSFETIPDPEFTDDGQILNEELSPPISDNNTKIVLTTFEQLRIHRLKNIKIPKDWIIWFDDPDTNDVIDISPYDTEKWNELSDEELEKKTKEINGRRYFKRNIHQSLGYPLKDYKCIYTTTEIITRRLIELMMKNRNEKYEVHDEMDNITGGKITILGTRMVRKRFDGIIPLLVRRLTKSKYPIYLIADGLSSEYNHSNNKGRNDLNHINLLVELSISHEDEIRSVCDSLEISFIENRGAITQSLILDKLHQAIGRNSGYRWKGYECVVLVDKQVHNNILNETRYKIDSKNSVLIDRTKSMSRNERRTKEGVTPIVKEIEYLLNNTDEYIVDNRKIRPDIKFVLDSIKDIEKKTSLVVRLLLSLTQLTGIEVKKEFNKTKPVSDIQKKTWDLIQWILDIHTSPGYKESVIRKLQKEIKRLN